MKILNEKSGIWKNKIKFPGSKVGVIPNSGFVNTLKNNCDKWLEYVVWPKEQAEVLMAFWDGINLHLKIVKKIHLKIPKLFQFKKLVQQYFMACCYQ